MHRDSGAPPRKNLGAKPSGGAPLYEFFAGGGLARLGLEPDFSCTFANDIDAGKARAYRAAFGGDDFHEGDIGALNAADLPGHAALAWASFPCQDVSLAGARGGLGAARSGTFWGFHRLIEALVAEDRAPPVLALENVCGLLSSNAGADFVAVVEALDKLGYRVGALEIDAALFTPQSRPRLFIIALRTAAPKHLMLREPAEPFHTPAIRNAVEKLPEAVQARWIWWRLATPPVRNTRLVDVLDDAEWDDAEKTEKLIGQMSPLHRARLETLMQSGYREAGAVFRRIRKEDGEKVQRAEVRFDGIAGCLRTPAGGSSRQILLMVDKGQVRSRLISPREAARLMGVPDFYPLPESQTAALQVMGDGVCVSAVRWLSQRLLAPLAGAHAQEQSA